MLNKNSKLKVQSSKLSNGFGLIEIVVASALISSSLFALAFVSQMALRASGENLNTVKAVYLAEEALEAVRSIRDDGWTANMSGLELDKKYYPSFVSSEWVISTTTPDIVDGFFEREINFEQVWRRTSDDEIVPFDDPDDKYLDDETLLVKADVSWKKQRGNATSTYEALTYLSNVFLD